MDNNHAWAEVFLDGAWHYTGDMDAAWYPDQTWFSGMIDKTVLILADGSLADQSDEVLSRGTYDTLINSTRNYAKERSRLVKLKVWDCSGKAASKVRVIPMVFNWGSLRALTALDTDEQGLLNFTVGRGAFYLSLFANNQKALCFIPSNSQDTLSMEIHLSVRDFEAQSQLMEFPSNPMQWDTQPESYRKAVEAEKQLWNRKTEDFRQTIPADMDSLAIAVAEECRGNYLALQHFLQAQSFVEAEFWEFLLMHDPKFLWQASAVQFQALYANFLMQKPYLSGGEEDLSLLSPTIYYEDLPLPFYDKNAKPRLYPEHFMVSGTAPRDRVKLVMLKLAKKHKVNNKKALSGLLTLNIAQAEKHLSSVQYRILACNMLRANGIPAEFSRIPDLITIFVDGDWEYYNVTKQIWENRSETSQETMHLWVQIEDESGIPIQAGEEQLTLCRYVDGMFYPLNHRFEYKGKGMHQGSYSRQDCYLQFGYRISESQTGFHLQPIKAEMADSTTVRFVAKNYPRTWNPATEDILAMVGADILNANTAIIIGNYDQENSKRLADKLLESNTEFLWLGYQNSATAPENYLVHPVWVNWVAEDSHNVMRSITLIKNSGEWQMYEGLWEKLP